MYNKETLTQEEYLEEFDQILKSNMKKARKEADLLMNKFSPDMSLKEAAKIYANILELDARYGSHSWSLQTMSGNTSDNEYENVKKSFNKDQSPYIKTSKLFSKLYTFMFNDLKGYAQNMPGCLYDRKKVEEAFKKAFNVENEDSIGNEVFQQLIEKFVGIDSGFLLIEKEGYDILGDINDSVFNL